MFKQLSVLVWAVLVTVGLAHADVDKTFMLQEGAFPWYDRVNQWALTDIPTSLNGTGPVPQQSCSSRSLEIAENPKSITIGISKSDLDKFKQEFPATVENGESIAVRDPAGNKIPYVIATLTDPPAKIDGAGHFGAGLLLLKMDGAASQAAPAAALAPPKPSPVPGIQSAPSAPVAGDKTFVVHDGTFPWYDRVNQWALDSVPESLKDNGPIPQQNCSSRTLDTPDRSRAVTLGVSENDLAKFRAIYPNASETGEGIAVKNPQGQRIAYRVVNLPNPPTKIGEGAGFGAGLLLLKVEDATATPAAPRAALPATAQVTSVTSALSPIVAPVIPLPIPAAAVAVAPMGAALPAREKFQIYLLMGQSNMVGRDTSSLASQVDNPRVLALDGNGRWLIAHEPMHVGGTGIGPGVPFALEMLKANPNATIGLVPCAVGGTPLSRWVKGADLYERAITRAKLAAQSGVIKGALWHQGESDTGKQEDADSYETRLTQMFMDLRQDLGLPGLPIVVGQLGDFLMPERYPFVETVRGGIEHIAVIVPTVGFADATGLGDKGDKLHFSAEAQKEFGARFAAAMLFLQVPPKPLKTQPKPQKSATSQKFKGK